MGAFDLFSNDYSGGIERLVQQLSGLLSQRGNGPQGAAGFAAGLTPFLGNGTAANLPSAPAAPQTGNAPQTSPAQPAGSPTIGNYAAGLQSFLPAQGGNGTAPPAPPMTIGNGFGVNGNAPMGNGPAPQPNAQPLQPLNSFRF